VWLVIKVFLYHHFESTLLLGNLENTWWIFLLIFLIVGIGFLLVVVFGILLTVGATVTVGRTLLDVAVDGDTNSLHDTLGPEDKFSKKDPNTNRWVHEDSIEWIDIVCKDNKKIYDPNGDIIVIGHPSSKIHTMATYDVNGNLIEDSSVKVENVGAPQQRKVIFLDPDDKENEESKLKKLFREGFISKDRYNSIKIDFKGRRSAAYDKDGNIIEGASVEVK